ncbi:MAG TPA: DUF6174 domain-containing protein [Longimicrobium sp.]|jgi:hypothetical protein
MRPSLRTLCFALLVLAGCTRTPIADAPDAGESPQAQQWESRRMDDYRFDFEQQCFCLREQTLPVTIEVRDGRVARVVVRTTGQDLTGRENLRWPTVPELFRLVDQARQSGTEPLVVRYDEQLRYPTYIEAGSLAADAGVIYRATNLRPL